ncbi:hypothetical protein [Streptomyces sp. NBC_00063]
MTSSPSAAYRASDEYVLGRILSKVTVPTDHVIDAEVVEDDEARG